MDIEVLSDLIGKTLINVENVDDEEIVMMTSELEVYKFWHQQDCCEDVRVEDIIGDLSDLIGSPLLMAEVTSEQGETDYGDSFTWTFYKFATLKGYVTIRWYGSSNGYYSESVSFGKVTQ